MQVIPHKYYTKKTVKLLLRPRLLAGTKRGGQFETSGTKGIDFEEFSPLVEGSLEIKLPTIWGVSINGGTPTKWMVYKGRIPI